MFWYNPYTEIEKRLDDLEAKTKKLEDLLGAKPKKAKKTKKSELETIPF